MRADFSEQVETLTTYLLRRAPRPARAGRGTGLPPLLVRNILLARMQQNIVSCPLMPDIDTSYAAA